MLFHGGITPKRALITGAKRVLYPLADSITAVASSVARDVCTQLRVPHVDVVFNPIVTDDVLQGAGAPLTHRFWRHDDDGAAEADVIVAVGRMVKEKGFDVLLRAFAEVRRKRNASRHANTRLVILGDGPLRRDLEELARALGVRDDVDMPGFDKNPFKYMARASVFVLSSRHEGLPGALIQAMACGAPVISTDCPGGPSEIIERPGVDGLLVPVDDVGALADAITRVLDEPALRTALAQRARRAAARFDLASSLALYMEAIAPRSEAAAA